MEDVIKFLEDCVKSYHEQWNNGSDNYIMAKSIVEAEELLIRARKVYDELKK